MHFSWFNTAIGWALFLLIIGVIIIIAGAYIAMSARKRHPSPS